MRRHFDHHAARQRTNSDTPYWLQHASSIHRFSILDNQRGRRSSMLTQVAGSSAITFAIATLLASCASTPSDLSAAKTFASGHTRNSFWGDDKLICKTAGIYASPDLKAEMRNRGLECIEGVPKFSGKSRVAEDSQRATAAKASSESAAKPESNGPSWWGGIKTALGVAGIALGVSSARSSTDAASAQQASEMIDNSTALLFGNDKGARSASASSQPTLTDAMKQGWQRDCVDKTPTAAKDIAQCKNLAAGFGWEYTPPSAPVSTVTRTSPSVAVAPRSDSTQRAQNDIAQDEVYLTYVTAERRQPATTGTNTPVVQQTPPPQPKPVPSSNYLYFRHSYGTEVDDRPGASNPWQQTVYYVEFSHGYDRPVRCYVRYGATVGKDRYDLIVPGGTTERFENSSTMAAYPGRTDGVKIYNAFRNSGWFKATDCQFVDL